MTPRFLFVAAAVCLFAGAAAAQTSSQPAASSAAEYAHFRAACQRSAFRVCFLQAVSGDHAATQACMIRHVDKLSAGCQAVVRPHIADTGRTTPH
jgi:curli biogenesis system outer membrane secretion channel CsgG